MVKPDSQNGAASLKFHSGPVGLRSTAAAFGRCSAAASSKNSRSFHGEALKSERRGPGGENRLRAPLTLNARLWIKSTQRTDPKPTGRPESLARALNPKGETMAQIETADGP